jgi:hypothetical protein
MATGGSDTERGGGGESATGGSVIGRGGGGERATGGSTLGSDILELQRALLDVSVGISAPDVVRNSLCVKTRRAEQFVEGIH